VSQDRPNVLGYVRKSSLDDGPPIKEQVAAIRALAGEINGQFVQCHVEPEETADEPLDTRPAYLEMLTALKTGDHIALFRLATFAPSPRELADAVKHLAARRAHIHTAGEKGAQFNLDPVDSEAMVRSWTVYEEAFAAQVKTSTRRALRKKKAAGLVYCSIAPFGKKRVKKKFGGQVLKFDLWNEQQCDIIREIKRRRDSGESLQSIAQSFHNRRMKLPDGREWAPKRRGKFSTFTIQRALRFYEALLAEGRNLGDSM